MELKFAKTSISCLDPVTQEIQNSEQTQEIKLSDGMPDIGHVVSAWGQTILRGKEWRGDSVSFSGGMMVWVLYAPEDGGTERCIDAWIPFQMRWDIPDGTPEGSIRIQCLTRFVDARSVSPRKLMVRAGMGAIASVLAPKTAEVYSPDASLEGVELLENVYPVPLPKEAGEKTFLQDEDLAFPDSVPRPDSLIYYRVHPRIGEKKVLTNKVVFRGINTVHVLFRSEQGQLHNWDFEVPFSQYADLNGEYGTDAQADFWLCPTNLELETDEDGHLRLKCGIVAQYLITDRQSVSVIEDAYSPGRELSLSTDTLELPAILDTRRENMYAEQSIPGEANVTADVSFLPDFPRQRRTQSGVEMEVPGAFQILYYGEDGALHGASGKWEGRQSVNADDTISLCAVPVPTEPDAALGSGNILVKAELPLEMTSVSSRGIPMVTGLSLGERLRLDPGRPSLILRRAGEERLWDIAKNSGSTVEAIRNANDLENEPAPNQMLLIPVN